MNRSQIKKVVEIVNTKNSWGKNNLKDLFFDVAMEESPDEALTTNNIPLITKTQTKEIMNIQGKTNIGKNQLKEMILNAILNIEEKK